MMIQIDLRRDRGGSIDIPFYRERAARLRREAILDLVATISELVLAWFGERRASASRRAVRQ